MFYDVFMLTSVNMHRVSFWDLYAWPASLTEITKSNYLLKLTNTLMSLLPSSLDIFVFVFGFQVNYMFKIHLFFMVKPVCPFCVCFGVCFVDNSPCILKGVVDIVFVLMTELSINKPEWRNDWCLFRVPKLSSIARLFYALTNHSDLKLQIYKTVL